jgi:Tfp pilus assembly protein PilN
MSGPPTSSPFGPPAVPPRTAPERRDGAAGRDGAAPRDPELPSGAAGGRRASGEASLASQALGRAAGDAGMPEGPAAPPPAPPAAAAPAAPYERMALNLARRPFVNSRPVKRLAILLWALGLLLLAGNVSLFWRYLGSSEQTRAALARAERKAADERQQVSRLAAHIAGMNLDQQNRKVAYLNRKIAERTFSWSLLFDRLAEVLPNGVRLNQLAPQGPAEKEQQPSRTGPITTTDRNTPVLIQIVGEAKNDEALLQFVDRLFQHPAFADPDLGREERIESGLLKFDLKVKYLPGAGAPASEAAPATRRQVPR